jgi:hypothetical protein
MKPIEMNTKPFLASTFPVTVIPLMRHDGPSILIRPLLYLLCNLGTSSLVVGSEFYQLANG